MLGQLVRQAYRSLVREPAFTIAAVLTLSLGVGANVAVFAVVQAVLLRPLPYPDAERLAILQHRDQRTGTTKEFIAIGDYVDLAARQTAFEALSGYGDLHETITGYGDPFRADGLSVGPGFLELLRVRPVIGRSLVPDDSRPGAPPVMLLGYDLWQGRFGMDPHVLGRTIKVGDTERQVVGVTPPGFGFPPTARDAVIVPMTVPLSPPANRKSDWTFAVGRFAPHRALGDAQTDLAAISRQLAREYPQSNQASVYFAVPLRTALLGDTKPALVLLFAAVGVVLLIACGNVANLLLARSLGRRREMALRVALGAGRARLATQLLAESLALSVLASVVGIFIAYWGSHVLVALLPDSSQVPGLADVRIDGWVLAFTLGVTVVTAVAFGLVAAFTVQSNSSAAILVGPGRASVGAAARRATSGLVAAEVALSVILLIGAGLILRSFAGLLAVDPGFRTDHVMTIGIQLPAGRYHDAGARDAFYSRVFAALRGLATVADAGAAAVVPLTGNTWTVGFERPEQPVPAGERPPEVGWQLASGGYFTTLRIPLVTGRLFDDHDRPDTRAVVIVSEATQRRFFPNGSAVGHQIKLGTSTADIVGVVGNIRRAGLRDEPRADMYFPLTQLPSPEITIFVRTSSDPARALGSLEDAIRSVEPTILFRDTRSLAEVASESVRLTKLIFLLLGIFASMALALAAVGIYSVMSYAVRQRTREIGTRIALGATRRDILWLVMRQGGVIAAIGTGAGLVLGLAATRMLRSVLYDVSASDPVTLSGVVIVLVATVLAACYVPARMAASVDPAHTLTDQ
jgi:putative ABC transport system permease protein